MRRFLLMFSIISVSISIAPLLGGCAKKETHIYNNGARERQVEVEHDDDGDEVEVEIEKK